MSWATVAFANVPAQPWKNGGGITRELLAWPNQDNWNVRISVAQISSDGPFSLFEQVQRWFCVLEGAGVSLTVDGRTHELTQTSDPVTFSGATITTCRLVKGETQDFNVMLRGTQGTLQRVNGHLNASPGAKRFVAVYSNRGVSTIHFSGTSFNLAAQTLVWQVTESAVALQISGADCLYMEIPL